jgi:hypothetical protein
MNFSHRAIRHAGFVACLAGVLVMVLAKFTAMLPTWAAWAGLAIVALGWGLFALSILRRTVGRGSNR